MARTSNQTPRRSEMNSTITELAREAIYCPQRWNKVCRATIPASWRIYNDEGWIIGEGDTAIEAAEDAAATPDFNFPSLEGFRG